MDLKPGNYRYAELAEICGVSRTTAEKFLERYHLTEALIPYNGREVKGVTLTQKNCEAIKRDYQGVLKDDTMPTINPYSETNNGVSNPINSTVDTEIKELLKNQQALLQKLVEERTQLPALNNQLEAANSIIKNKLKEQEEKTLLLEKQVQELKAVIEQMKNNAESKKPWWQFWK